MEKKTPYAPNNLTERPIAHYMESFRTADPYEISERTGVPFTDKTFHLNVLGRERLIDWPEFKNDGFKDKEKILFLHYLLEGKKVSPSVTFSSYADLPWGNVYDRNFRARCVNRLVGTFGTRIEAFQEAAEKLGGRMLSGSGVTAEFTFMENLNVRFILWEGDEEFPASGQILFSDNFPDAFAAEDRVVVCETILGYLR